ncbi:hypothetical protein HS99_0016425 [Kitasatospora aureofaciens]|uniref:Uncharacterized protein n=1 Tax=Kitasatospora aureofaciens TaxID=1894 RepID=A0A1E7MV39_KITAU|nr:hypothetical protein HS99_0016425 [Kitasatospora aureofaciens]
MRLVGPVAEGVGEQALPGDLGEQFGADLVTAVDQSGQRGDAFPGEATDAPIVLGITTGSLLGSRLSGRLSVGTIEAVYTTVVLASGLSFLLGALGVINV